MSILSRVSQSVSTAIKKLETEVSAVVTTAKEVVKKAELPIAGSPLHSLSSFDPKPVAAPAAAPTPALFAAPTYKRADMQAMDVAKTNAVSAVKQTPADLKLGANGIDVMDHIKLAELKKSSTELPLTKAKELEKRMVTVIENAQKNYGDIIAKGGRIVATASDGNGGQPSLTIVPPGFNPAEPARVHTHYHGNSTTITDPIGDGGTPARLRYVQAMDPQTVFVLPEDAATRPGGFEATWMNVKSQADTTSDALKAAGVNPSLPPSSPPDQPRRTGRRAPASRSTEAEVQAADLRSQQGSCLALLARHNPDVATERSPPKFPRRQHVGGVREVVGRRFEPIAERVLRDELAQHRRKEMRRQNDFTAVKVVGETQREPGILLVLRIDTHHLCLHMHFSPVRGKR